MAEQARQGGFDDDDAEPTAYQVHYAIHTYCSVCGHDWAAVLQLPPSQQRFLECPECRCWSRVNLIDDELSQ